VRFFPRILLTFITLASCRDNGIEDSAEVSTRDIRVVVEVNADAGRTMVRAYPSALLPYSGALQLTGGDQLLLQGEGPLSREEGTQWYARESSRDRGRFALDLERPADRPLRDLGVEVPAPFTLTTPSSSIKWSERIELTWERADGDHAMSVEVTSECSKRWLRYLESDTGAYTINGGELARLTPSAPCKVRVTMVRAAKPLSTANMYARAAQERTVEVTLQP